MNWKVSKLDKYRLVSNSDAHSPSKLAREATVFDTEPDYYSIMNALKTGVGYVGTVEFSLRKANITKTDIENAMSA